MNFIASNYAMGRAVKTVQIEAPSFAAAIVEAERLLPGAHAGPASVGRGGKTRVIGVRHA